jgi:hypothetical protein
MPLEDRIKQPLSVLVTWLSAVHPAFEEARIRDDEIDSDMEDKIAEELEIEQAHFKVITTAGCSQHPFSLPAAPILCGCLLAMRTYEAHGGGSTC